MKKTLFILSICFLIIGSFSIIPDAKAAACPSDVVKASAGTCGVEDAVKESDGWCCKSPSEVSAGNFECVSGYCGSPDGAGGKYSDYKCCKPKAADNADANAQNAGNNQGGGGSSVSLANLSPVGEAKPEVIIGNVIKAVLGVVGAIALFMFVYGGMYMLTSAGSPEKVKKGKDVLIWAVIGLAVIFGSYYLVDFAIKGITGAGGGGGGSPSQPGSPATQTCADWYNGAVCTDLRSYSEAGKPCEGKNGTALSECVIANSTSTSGLLCVADRCPSDPHGVVCCRTVSGN